jgi:hypothetical protein
MIKERKVKIVELRPFHKLKSSGWSAHSHDYVDAMSDNGHKVSASVKAAEFASMYVTYVKNKEI